MAFASAADALRLLLSGKEVTAEGERCWICKTPSGLMRSPGGIPHYYVEVVCSNSARYYLPAFGEEALELLKEAKKVEPPISLVKISP